MITQLNINSNSWTKIYSVDLEGYSSDKFESLDDYLTEQIDSIVSNQFEIGYELRTMTPYNNNYILVFTPHPRR